MTVDLFMVWLIDSAQESMNELSTHSTSQSIMDAKKINQPRNPRHIFLCVLWTSIFDRNSRYKKYGTHSIKRQYTPSCLSKLDSPFDRYLLIFFFFFCVCDEKAHVFFFFFWSGGDSLPPFLPRLH